MCWAALGMMIACTAAAIYDPVRKSEADSILMARYLALYGLVAAYFALRKRLEKFLNNQKIFKSPTAETTSWLSTSTPALTRIFITSGSEIKVYYLRIGDKSLNAFHGLSFADVIDRFSICAFSHKD